MAKKQVKETADDADEISKSGSGDDGPQVIEGVEIGVGNGDAAKKKKKKILIIGILALVLIVGGSAAAYFSGMFSKHEEKPAADVGPDGKPLDKPVFYTLPEFLVNLNSGAKQSSFLKTTVILEVAHQTDVPQIEANLPRLLDALNTYLRELRPNDLAGSAGVQRLREELLLRANKVMSPIKLNDVLFKEIIVQ